MTYERELEVAEAAARAAGELVLRHQKQGITVDRKAGNEPVTEADRQASVLVLEALARAFPDDVLVSEEAPDDPRRLQGGRVWFVDPIDRTLEAFALRDSAWTLIAALKDADEVRVPPFDAISFPLSVLWPD